MKNKFFIELLVNEMWENEKNFKNSDERKSRKWIVKDIRNYRLRVDGFLVKIPKIRYKLYNHNNKYKIMLCDIGISSLDNIKKLKNDSYKEILEHIQNGCSYRFISDKFKIGFNTISSLISNSKKSENQNRVSNNKIVE